MIKSSFLIIFLLLFQAITFCQNNQPELKTKELPATILQKRSLLLPGNFDGIKALRTLFPGNYYDLSKKDSYENKLINWSCKKCIAKAYKDVNEVEGDQSFPYQEGVATRLISVTDMTDATGGQYKMLAFNHSVFDSYGMQTGRFSGGLLGLAKFAKTDSGWLLRSYQPAITAYGAFAQCPKPTAILIGNDQYAFLIRHSNGGGGGVYNANYYLLVGIDGSYKQQMAAYNIGQSNTPYSYWESNLSVPKTEKTYFRDLLITTTGVYIKSDEASVPPEIQNKVKGLRSCSFSFSKRFVYNAAKGYEEKETLDIILTNMMKQ